MKVAFYGRHSTDRQSDASIADQYRNCRDYAEHYGWTIGERYEDRGQSGATANRPEYQRMLADAEAAEFDVLLVDDMSRISRNFAETAQVIDRLLYQGRRLIAVSDGFDTDDENHEIGTLVHGFKNSIYLKDLRKKTHRGLTGKVLKGRAAGGRSYGYRSVRMNGDTRFEVDPAEAKWVRWIFERYAEGRSHRWIAHELNRLGVRSSRGGTWSPTAIYGDQKKQTGLLNNELYVGRYVWNRSKWLTNPETGKRRRVMRPASEHVSASLPDLRIVSDKLWKAVKARQQAQHDGTKQRRQQKHHRAGPGRSPRYLFSGLLKCAECGANFIMVDAYRYGCSTNRNRGATACGNAVRVPRRLVEERLLAAIRDDLFDPARVAAVKESVLTALRERDDLADREQRHLRDQLQQVRTEIDNLVNAIKSGADVAEVRGELVRCKVRETELRRTLNTEDLPASAGAVVRDRLDDFQTVLDGIEALASQDKHAARELIRSLLGGPILLTPTEDGHLMAELRGNVGGFVGLRANRDDLTFVFRVEVAPFDLMFTDADKDGKRVIHLVEFKNLSGCADGGANGTKKFAANREQLAAAMSKLMLVAGARNQRYLHLTESWVSRVP